MADTDQMISRRAQGFGTAQDAVDMLALALRVGVFKYRYESKIKELMPEIQRRMKKHFGVLIYVRINSNCDSGSDLFAGMKILGSGATPWQAYQETKNETSLWSDCGRVSSLYLWKTPIDMGVVNADYIRATEHQVDFDESNQKLRDELDYCSQ